jgi:hypothetical protein
LGDHLTNPTEDGVNEEEQHGAAEYLHLMKGFADAIATVGTPVRDEELIDYIIASLIALFAALEALLTVFIFGFEN